MKSFIRWLADISGVTLDIYIKAEKDIGHQIWHNAMWFSSPNNLRIMKAFELYSEYLKNAQSPNMSEIRAEINKIE
jgi:hypothetical protein